MYSLLKEFWVNSYKTDKVAFWYELLSVINNLKNGDEKTEENVQDNGNYFSWAEKKDVKKFIQSNKKYVELRDFFSLVFYNPKKF